jgi:hypothetical protein
MTQTSHAHMEELGFLDTSSMKVPGYVFRWVNLAQRHRKGWGIWTPVTRNSEIGQQVLPQLGYINDKFMGANAEANLIYQSAELVLSYTTVEKNEALKEHNATKAENRIRSVDAAELRRNVIVPASGGYIRSIGGNS